MPKLKNSNETFFGNFQRMFAVKIPENSNLLELQKYNLAKYV